jgi:ABC-type cobalamin/Fe3+-siderophores transport system ATPase subunit
MRLKHVFISEYKNLKNFTLDFDNDSFLEVLVGKNGSGKSNLLEALIEIFRHLYEQKSSCSFEYKIRYLLDETDVSIEWSGDKFYLNGAKRGTRTFTTQPLPENVLIYYSGHNSSVTNLINRYEESFKSSIRGANINEARKFIGIGPMYKSLLLSVLLFQPDSCKAKRIICQKLGITAVNDTVQVGLKRPAFAASRLKELDLEAIESFDQRSHYWGADGITGEFLNNLKSCIKGEFNHSSIYVSEKDQYKIPVNIELFQKVFESSGVFEQFTFLDNLKTLGMLSDINVDVTTTGDKLTTLNHFSDGQLQSVYIYAVSEVFKDKHCITLLDEPDSFLHPEWQFDFLKQVDDISEGAARTNHVLMTSHSASTISSVDDVNINVLENFDGVVSVGRGNKSDVIKSLSSGLISFSEGEAKLNINHVLENTSGPVLFTEGITDEMILEVAWDRLNPGEARPFHVQGAFDRIFLRNLFSRDELQKNYPSRIMAAIFDFDEAFDDWNGLRAKEKGVLVESNPYKGLCKQLKCETHYAFLLPVPNDDAVKPQVLQADGSIWGKGIDSHLPIELLFYSEDLLKDWFEIKVKSGGGQIIEFTGDKVRFAKDIIPALPRERFELFTPIFELIKQLIVADEHDVVAA